VQGLAARENKFKRRIEPKSTCRICGRDPESIHHALMGCSHAWALWSAMLKHWELPPPKHIVDSGPEWLLLLIVGVSKHIGSLISLLCWRIWFVINEFIHNGRSIPISSTIGFLCNYLDELLNVQDREFNANCSGKRKANLQLGEKTKIRRDPADDVLTWEAPAEGWIKINVDGAYNGNGLAGVGLVI
jgi:hypothetical protein